MLEEETAGEVIGAAIQVHKALGPGLLEGAYLRCLAHELLRRGRSVRTEVPLPITYRGVRIDCSYRLDLVIDDAVLVEAKSVATLLPIHEAQLMTYLRLSPLRVGLLLNFNVPRLRDGIVRRVV
jgi:GxxExxY protein